MVDEQEKKQKSWKETPTPAWLRWITAIYLIVGLFVLFYTATFAKEYPLAFPLALLVYLACAGLLYLTKYIHGKLYITGRLPSKPTERTPTAFMKKCVKCGIEIPIASEECPSCRSKQP